MLKIYGMGLEFFRKKLEVCRCILLLIWRARSGYWVTAGSPPNLPFAPNSLTGTILNNYYYTIRIVTYLT